jgi:putative restriction endonuclease
VIRADGAPLPSTTPERRRVLVDAGARGQLRPEVEVLLSNPAHLAMAAQLLLDEHFTPTLARLIVEAVGLDLDPIASMLPAQRRRRAPGFAEVVKRACAYQCAMCGFDGALGRVPVALEAAHVRWHSQDGPDELENGLCLCELHHALFDLGVIGLTDHQKVTISPLYVARTPAGRAIDALAGTELATPRTGQQLVELQYVRWHTVQVFKLGTHAA